MSGASLPVRLTAVETGGWAFLTTCPLAAAPSAVGLRRGTLAGAVGAAEDREIAARDAAGEQSHAALMRNVPILTLASLLKCDNTDNLVTSKHSGRRGTWRFLTGQARRRWSMLLRMVSRRSMRTPMILLPCSTCTSSTCEPSS